MTRNNFRLSPSLALNRGPAGTDIASNSDKPTSQHSLDENRVYSVLLYCSRRIRFSSKGDPHEHIHRHDFLRQRLYNPPVGFWEVLWVPAAIHPFLCLKVPSFVKTHKRQEGHSPKPLEVSTTA